MLRKIFIGVFAIFLVVSLVAIPKSSFGAISVLAQSADPIPDLIAQVDITNLTNVATTLVTQYGPRHENYNRPYIDASCTFSTSVVYPKSNIEMASDYVKGLFEAMGYPAGSITMEQVPNGAGHNVYVTKVGSAYPNTYIEFSAHLDSVLNSPGGADNASGSSAVVELARVLKDYPNRYSMRFILWVGEELNTQRNSAYYGSSYHVQQALARGEQVKAGLNMDHIGQPYPSDPTGYMNAISTNNAQSERIANIFNQVRNEYGIVIGYIDLGAIQNSDQISYWDRGQTAVSSGGGSFYYKPHYHNCGDTVSDISFVNTLRVTQQNLAVGLKLDAESYGPSATATITSTPTITSTATFGPSPTATNTPTQGGSAGFPSAGVLDNFDRADGVVGSNWSGRTTGFSISANQLRVAGSGEQDMYWSSTSFGADQEVYATLSTINQSSAEIGLALKSQSNSGASPGLIEVFYVPGTQQVQVWTYQGSQGWVQRGANIPVTFVNGDQFGARAKANGQVEVYKNGSLMGTRDITAWSYYAQGGYIGFFMYNGSNSFLDNFGGGTMGMAPTSTATFTPTNTPVLLTATYTPTTTFTPTFTATFTPTNTPVPLTATYTPTATFTPINTATFTPTATYTPTTIFTPTFTATFTPTNTPVPPTATYTPTNTATFTPSPTNTPASSDVLYLSSTTNGTVGGVAFADEDILSYNRTSGIWSMYFDGSDVGFTGDVDAFTLMSDGSLLISIDSDGTVGSLGTVSSSDIIRFIPTTLGPNTAGSFQWYFDGSDVGLTTTAENLDTIAFAPDGRLIISTGGSVSVTGVFANDEDLLAFTPTLLGSTTSGTWSLYFDGSDVGLNDAASEDINGAWIDPSSGKIYLTTLGAFSVTGVSGTGSDVFACAPGSLGATTTCTYTSYWLGSSNGFSGEIIDGLYIKK